VPGRLAKAKVSGGRVSPAFTPAANAQPKAALGQGGRRAAVGLALVAAAVATSVTVVVMKSLNLEALPGLQSTCSFSAGQVAFTARDAQLNVPLPSEAARPAAANQKHVIVTVSRHRLTPAV